MIPQHTIDQILQASNIVDVISEFVELKKAGVNYKGLSPFTTETHPSFIVSPTKEIFKCFSSGTGGGVIRFLMESQKYTYPEALKYLAKKYGITIEETDEKPDDAVIKKREQLINIYQFTATYYQNNLYKGENARGLEYILNRFSEEEINQWQIGYAMDAWDGFLLASKAAGYLEEVILDSGLVKESKSDRQYDFFRDRVMFPIFDITGRIIAFGGRIYPGVKDQAKYINSADSVVYDKGAVLYGLNFARKSIIEKDVCNLVEGYSDVIAMHTAKQTNTVAPCGTALTKNQINIIKRYTNNINLIYDGDTAGYNAAVKNGNLLATSGMQVTISILPEGQDPASYIKQITLQAN